MFNLNSLTKKHYITTLGCNLFLFLSLSLLDANFEYKVIILLGGILTNMTLLGIVLILLSKD